ncbi:hypothetical protein ACFYSC_12100 [Streptosporangium sp. NPDC004379]|uniref:hypothetical protein n=1 Tax=Streptosporangium sp. NPDC004379 TaxID=3366189 RepID=UPI00368DF744
MRKHTPALLAAGAVLAVTAGVAAAVNVTPAAQSAMAAASPAPAPGLTLDPDPLPTTGDVLPTPMPTESLGPEPSPIPEPALTAAPSDPGLPMPLDPFMTSMDDIHTIDLAKDAAAARCMRSLGFSAWTDGVVRNWNPEDYIEADLIEPLDATATTRTGYPRTGPDPAVAAQAEQPEDQRAATPEEMEAYDGTLDRTASGADIPEGGCEASGAAEVLDGDPALVADPRLLADDASFLALEHSAVKQALAGWTTCMSGKGYGYDSPMSARNDMRWAERAADEPATAAEKQVAAADAACAQSTGLLATYRAAKRAYEEIMVADRRPALTESRQVFDGWVRRAEAVLATR